MALRTDEGPDGATARCDAGDMNDARVECWDFLFENKECNVDVVSNASAPARHLEFPRLLSQRQLSAA
eukprot:2556631-Pyramimonas_sp.AAC.1